jgi:hypothetical protein
VFLTKFIAYVAMITAFWDVRLCRMVDIFYILITVLPLSSGSSETLVPTYCTT